MNILRISPGDEFGRLTVVRRDTAAPPSQCRSIFWECKCSCGNTKTVSRKYLTNGSTKSCGCLATEARRRRNFIKAGKTRGSVSAKFLWSGWDDINDQP